ncbi:AraC family transcriptional regulator [Shewanella psychropiezotolerans]|uniref:AraC family transcriptional regulator n=1 Tax=Shewanella psychropiezotolerans TaxID=2593655 RepID=A0ABX5X2U8_9GAMM|nr:MULTISPECIES: AraC family transcriptional regulator [Shewanella]MPY21610.1 AraC family transcriptional regulator [Shewanella sp. YLB-07]QDO84787.1 AraC family transcriptional regulator [Shewanella psychropiezotolerans]
MKLGDISVSYIEIMLKAMEHLKVECDEILDKYSIDSISLASPDARVSIPKFMRLGHDCIQACELPWLGLVMGEVTTATNLGIAGLLALSAQDLRQACHQIATFELLNKYNSRGQSQFFVSQAFGMEQDKYLALSREYGVAQGQGVLMFYSIKPYNDYNYFVVDSVLSGWCQIIQDLSGREDGIEKVCFEFPAPVYADKYHELFNCPVLFEQASNYIVIKAEALAWSCINRSAPTFELLRRGADEELEKVRLGLSFHEKVSRVIGPLLDGSTPTLEQVSEQLNMAPWTVRRKLVEEGGSFQQTLNDTRRTLAISYVQDTALTLGEIAYLLGFGSPTAFQRAFKRWTGEAPGRFRTANISPNKEK